MISVISPLSPPDICACTENPSMKVIPRYPSPLYLPFSLSLLQSVSQCNFASSCQISDIFLRIFKENNRDNSHLNTTLSHSDEDPTFFSEDPYPAEENTDPDPTAYPNFNRNEEKNIFIF